MWGILVVLFTNVVCAEIGDGVQDQPTFRVEMQILSFDTKEIKGRLRDGDLVLLDRSAINRPKVSESWDTYFLKIDAWANAKVVPKKKD